jgi:hypothetical protein
VFFFSFLMTLDFFAGLQAIQDGICGAG